MHGSFWESNGMHLRTVPRDERGKRLSTGSVPSWSQWTEGVNCPALPAGSQASHPGCQRRPGAWEVAQQEVLTGAPAQSRLKSMLNWSPHSGWSPKWAGGIWRSRQKLPKTGTHELVRPQKPKLQKFPETSKNNDNLLFLLIIADTYWTQLPAKSLWINHCI